MSPGLRKLVLASHVVTSVGWLGAVAVFLVLALAGLTSADAATLQAAYPAMGLATSFVIVPLCFASLVTGVAQSLGTPWGLFRYYWVVIKLVLTVLATLVLLLHTRPISELATIARTSPLSVTDHRALQIQLVVDAAAAVVVLLVATVLGVYKPRGMTRYGQRKQQS